MDSRLPKPFQSNTLLVHKKTTSWLSSIAAKVTLLRYAVRTSSETSLAIQQENSSPWSCSFWIIPCKNPARPGVRPNYTWLGQYKEIQKHKRAKIPKTCRHHIYSKKIQLVDETTSGDDQTKWCLHLVPDQAKAPCISSSISPPPKHRRYSNERTSAKKESQGNSLTLCWDIQESNLYHSISQSYFPACRKRLAWGYKFLGNEKHTIYGSP